MAVAAIKELLPAMNKVLIRCVRGVVELAECFEKLSVKIRSALTVIDELEGNVADLKNNAIECRTLLSKAYDCACVFMDRVEKCFDYADLSDEQREEIKAKANKGEFTKVRSYLNQLGRFFKQCDECYKKFEEFNAKAKPLCASSIKICDEKRQSSKGGTTTTAGKWFMGIGITAAIGGVATVAGLLTAGIGTPVVLGLSAAGSAVGGTATAVAGSTIKSFGEHYTKLEQQFLKIDGDFGKMQGVAQGLDRDMHQVRELLHRMELNRGNVLEIPEEDVYTFNEMFDNLINDIRKDKITLKQIQEKVKKDKDKPLCIESEKTGSS